MDPVGQSQVIPYLIRLAAKGASVTLISFEKRDRLKKNDLVCFQTKLLSRAKIYWQALLYHKKLTLPATFFDVLQGFMMGYWLIRRRKIQIIHARGYVAGLIGWLLKRLVGVRFVFDMRGFWADEKVDARYWSRQGLLYRLTKKIERILIFGADEIVVLTKAAQNILKEKFNLQHICVVPCCVDLSLFNLNGNGRKMPFLPERFPVIYVGSLGTFYQFEEMIRFFSLFQKKITRTFLLLITNSEPKHISNLLRSYGIKSEDYLVTSVPYHRVPEFLRQSKVSLIFYHRPLSRSGCCPIKFGESLACGVPVVINSGIGDCDEIVERERVGVIVRDFSLQSYQNVINQLNALLKEGHRLRERCRRTAEKYFSLEDGVKTYWHIYERLRIS